MACGGCHCRGACARARARQLRMPARRADTCSTGALCELGRKLFATCCGENDSRSTYSSASSCSALVDDLVARLFSLFSRSAASIFDDAIFRALTLSSTAFCSLAVTNDESLKSSLADVLALASLDEIEIRDADSASSAVSVDASDVIVSSRSSHAADCWLLASAGMSRRGAMQRGVDVIACVRLCFGGGTPSSSHACGECESSLARFEGGLRALILCVFFDDDTRLDVCCGACFDKSGVDGNVCLPTLFSDFCLDDGVLRALEFPRFGVVQIFWNEND